MNINWRMFIDLVSFLWRHSPRRGKYLLLILATFAGLSRDLVMVVVNKAAGSDVSTALHVWLPTFLCLLVTFIASSFSYQVLTTSVTTEVINRVRTNLIQKLLLMQPTFIERYEHGTLYHVLTTDVGVVAGFTSTLLGLLPLLVFLALAIPQLFFYSIVAGVFSVLVMVGGVLAYYLQQKSMANLGVDARKWDVAYFENVSGMLSGHRELKLNANRRSDFLGGLGSVLANLRAALIAVSKVYETGESVVNILKFALIGGIVFLVPFLSDTPSHVVFSLLTLVLFCLIPFEQLVSSYPAIVGTLVSFVRISALEKEITPHENVFPQGHRQQPFSGLALRSVVASHRTSAGTSFTLGPLDLDVAPNEIIFFVGENGSGKTTLLNVLAGLHDIDSGTVMGSGAIVSSEGMEAHRATISAVFARFHIFQTLLGLKDTPDMQANDMIEKVGLKDVTAVKAHALSRTELSAGQRRRLALAIALLEDRDVLILDEFVADQDPGQRKFFFHTLLPWLKANGKTVLLSIHDLSWTSACDRVVTLRDGRIESVVSPASPSPD